MATTTVSKITTAADNSLLGIQSQLAEIPYSVPKPTLPIRDKSKEDTILANASTAAKNSNDAYQKMIDAKLAQITDTNNQLAIATSNQAQWAADLNNCNNHWSWNCDSARAQRDVGNDNLAAWQNAQKIVNEELAILKREQTDKANAILDKGNSDAKVIYNAFLTESDNYNNVLLPAWNKSYADYQASEKARIAKVQLDMSVEQAKQTAAAEKAKTDATAATEKAKTDAVNAKLAQSILAKQVGISDDTIEKQSGTFVAEDNTNTLAKYGLWTIIIIVFGIVISRFSNN